MSFPDYQLKPSLSASFKGIIWKVETDAHFPFVAIESRDISNRHTYYSAYNYVNGQCLFKEITVEDSWFWSIDKIHNGIIFLHSYLNENNPEHKGILAFNTSGKMVWQQYHKTLYEVAEQGLIVYNPKIYPKNFDLISISDGATITSNVKQYKIVEREIIIPDMLDNTLPFSQLILADSIGPIFYKKFNGKDLFVFHTQTEKLYSQQVLVFQDKKVLLQDNLALGIQKMNPEAFFIQRNHLFYIRNDKYEFVSYLV